MSRLRKLAEHGQSVWVDQISREMLDGELQELLDAGVTGLTSNPSIFQKAIGGSAAYQQQLAQVAAAGASPLEIFEALAIQDLQAAADLLRPIYEHSGGSDGFVSMEVAPGLAHDTVGTIEEARRLWVALNRPNVMIKIPGTVEGLPAIEQALSEGINVNVTLLFSVERYRRVMEAYLRGLERRVAAGFPIAGIASVASFFVSRIDTLGDKLIDQRAGQLSGAEKEELLALRGKLAVANAKLAYAAYTEVFDSPRFEALLEHGAQVQRPLWASTSTKNPAYSDVLYVETLVGPHTVNTMPMETIAAFRDHGEAANTVEQGLDESREVVAQLERYGIALPAITAQLEREGVKAFADAFNKMLDQIIEQRKGVELPPYEQGRLGPLHEAVTEAVARMHDEGTMRRIWERDPSIWKSDAEHQKVINNRLGWLTSAELMRSEADGLMRFAREVRASGVQTVVLLGMGGSSLAPEVLQTVFGQQPGYPRLLVLDTTDAAAIRAVEAEAGLGNTLFVVASKSGSTVETASLDAYFFERMQQLEGEAAGQHFIAITDPGMALERSARERGFRRIFLNPADIGGRYSALSFFGLVPAALIGLDVRRLVDRALVMAQRCSPSVPAADNPALVLGCLMGVGALEGRDKLTLLTTPSFASFGYWVEQLVAESTGKEGRGVVPVEGEGLGDPAVYGTDRAFVYLRLEGDGTTADAHIDTLAQAGQPVLHINLRDRYDLAGEFLRWELATAVAGVLLGVNPFDEPNVTESKNNTKRLIELVLGGGELPYPEWTAKGQRVSVAGPEGETPAAALKSLLGQVGPGDYISILAYIGHTPERERLLRQIQRQLRDATGRAVTLGFGPRFLHSTGQLHKGGPNKGVFLTLIADDADDLAIPGQPFSFRTLKAAQALGDSQALGEHKRRSALINLGPSPERGLEELAQALG